MRFGRYFTTSAKNLREMNQKDGRGYCQNCGRDDAVETVYVGFVCTEAGECGILRKARGYQAQCRFCGCSFGEPFKIYFDEDEDEDEEN